jgi:FdhD protein
VIRSVPRRTTTGTRVLALRDGTARARPDRLATEEPMEIRAGGPDQEPVQVAVTMRTPGSDFELAAGFLFTEGLIAGPDDIASVAYCELPRGEQEYNVVTVRLASRYDPDALRRNFFATSSCGVCGKASLDDVELRCEPLPPGPVVPASTLAGLPDALRDRQRIFEETGGLHASGLFGTDGALRVLREDVGRHNAVDKVVGWALLRRAVPLSASILQVSGRLSFEIVQKAAVARVPIVSAVSAPSSLAVEAGERLGVTVAGFVRQGGLNVYAHPERIDPER